MKLLYVLLLFGTISCKKADELHFPEFGLYTPTFISDISPLKMYTSNGENVNQQFIKDYLQRRNKIDFFNFESFEPVTEAMSRTKISFISDTSAIVFNFKGRDTLHSSIERKDANVLVITPFDGYLGHKSINRCDSAEKMVRAYPMIQKNCFNITGGAVCLTRNQLPIGFKDQKFYIPLINFMSSQESRYYYCNVAASNDWNFFNKDFAQLLQQGDTLVVQTKFLFLSK